MREHSSDNWPILVWSSIYFFFHQVVKIISQIKFFLLISKLCYVVVLLVCAIQWRGIEGQGLMMQEKNILREEEYLLIFSCGLTWREGGRWVGGCWQSDVFFGLHYSTRRKITNSNVLIELKKKAAGGFRRNSDDHIPFPMLFVWTMRLDYWPRAIPVTWKF